jgi:hypothetical protein
MNGRSFGILFSVLYPIRHTQGISWYASAPGYHSRRWGAHPLSAFASNRFLELVIRIRQVILVVSVKFKPNDACTAPYHVRWDSQDSFTLLQQRN